MREILFEDEFEGTRLKDHWRHRWNGNADMVSVKDGAVHLSAMSDGQGGFWQGSIGTGEVGQDAAFAMSYGWIAARVKVHAYHGSHCAVWAQSRDGYTLDDPTTPMNERGSEVDVFEHFGAHNPDRKSGTSIQHAVHWNDGAGMDKAVLSRNWVPGWPRPWYRDYHTFKAHLSPKEYRFYIDNKLTGIIARGQSISPKFLVLSMLVSPYEAPDMAHPEHRGVPRMSVKWIRAWR